MVPGVSRSYESRPLLGPDSVAHRNRRRRSRCRRIGPRVDTTLLIYRRPSPNLADHTQVRFWCTDVAADVRELFERGVEFDLVEFGDFKMVDHVLTTPVGNSAWFKDPDCPFPVG